MNLMSDREYHAASALAYRLVLAQLNNATDAIQIIEQELTAEDRERPDRLVGVLAVMLGLATTFMSQQFGGPATATRVLEKKLAEALDALDDDQT